MVAPAVVIGRSSAAVVESPVAHELWLALRQADDLWPENRDDSFSILRTEVSGMVSQAGFRTWHTLCRKSFGKTYRPTRGGPNYPGIVHVYARGPLAVDDVGEKVTVFVLN